MEKTFLSGLLPFILDGTDGIILPRMEENVKSRIVFLPYSHPKGGGLWYDGGIPTKEKGEKR